MNRPPLPDRSKPGAPPKATKHAHEPVVEAKAAREVEPPAPKSKPVSVGEIRDFFEAFYGSLEEGFGPEFKVPGEKLDKQAERWTRTLNHYFPNALDTVAILNAALAVILSVSIFAACVIKRVRRGRDEAAKAQANEAPVVGRVVVPMKPPSSTPAAQAGSDAG